MPSVIFFDAAGTLIAPHPSVGERYAAVARDFGLDADPLSLEEGFRAAFRAARRAIVAGAPPYGRTHDEAHAFWRPVVAAAFSHAQLAMPEGTYFDTVYATFATRDSWRVYDDVAPAIELARNAGVRIGLLSNFDPRLRPLLDDLRIAHHFDPILISCEVGSEKPHPAVFEAARVACGELAPDQFALIGDTPDEDIAGALNAGWRACLVDRDDRYPHHHEMRAGNLVEAVQCVLA